MEIETEDPVRNLDVRLAFICTLVEPSSVATMPPTTSGADLHIHSLTGFMLSCAGSVALLSTQGNKVNPSAKQ